MTGCDTMGADEDALNVLSVAPMVIINATKSARTGYYTGVGGRRFSPGTIRSLVDRGLAVYVGRGVVSCRMMREAATAMSTAKNT